MSQPEHAERELVERARQGDRAAQQQLWRSHRRWVAAIVLAHRPRELDVDDLMQDVAVKFIDKIDTLRDAASFRPWMRQVILNVCRGAARSLRPTLSLDVGRDEDAGADGPRRTPRPEASDGMTGQTVDAPDAARRLLAHVRSLPPEYREPLLLRCVRSLSYVQIAAVLDLPVTTIETRLARARRMLRDELSESVFVEGH